MEYFESCVCVNIVSEMTEYVSLDLCLREIAGVKALNVEYESLSGFWECPHMHVWGGSMPGSSEYASGSMIDQSMRQAVARQETMSCEMVSARSRLLAAVPCQSPSVAIGNAEERKELLEIDITSPWRITVRGRGSASLRFADHLMSELPVRRRQKS